MFDPIQIPSSPTSLGLAHQLAALVDGAISVPLAGTGWIRVSGEDRVRWLNGMVTNSIVALGPGDGCYNFLLNAQGRIQGTAWAFAEPDALLLETDLAQVEPLMALLDRFIIMDDVDLADLSADNSGLLLAGPHAPPALTQCGLLEAIPPSHASARLENVSWNGETVRLLSKPGRIFPTWEIWGPPSLLAEIAGALERFGAVAGDPDILDAMRLLEGTPKFGADIRDRELPQETGQLEALHFSKGCYLGQEIVERIRSRGNVHRIFHGFLLAGSLPTPGASLEASGKIVGELTSVSHLPAFPGYPDGLALGLGYIRREAVDLGHSITFSGGTAQPTALPVTLNHALRTALPVHPTHEVA